MRPLLPLSAVCAAEAVIAFYIAMYVFALWVRRRRPEWLLFSGLAFAGGMCSVAMASLLQARIPMEAEPATGGVLLSAFAVTLIGCALGMRLARGDVVRAETLQGRVSDVRPVSPESKTRAGTALAAAGLLTCLVLWATGALTGTALSPLEGTWGLHETPLLFIAPLTRWALIPIALSWLGALVTWVALLSVERPYAEVRMLQALFAAGVVTAGHDIAVVSLSLRSVPLFPHLVAVGVMASTIVLVGRLARARDALRVRTQQLRRSLDILSDTEGELLRAEQLATVGGLSGALAHEVRNPLGVVRNVTSLLRRQPAGDRDALLSMLDDEIDRLNRLVSDLLVYAKPIHPQRRRTELDQLFAGAIGRVNSRHPSLAERLTLQIEAADTTYSPELDSELLSRALDALIDNAASAMPDGGTITLNASYEPGGVLAVEVRDTGPGMAPEIRARAVEPFFSTHDDSTGLGLAIVAQVAAVHGGTVELDSQPDTGTSVRLRLPTKREATGRFPTLRLPPLKTEVSSS